MKYTEIVNGNWKLFFTLISSYDLYNCILNVDDFRIATKNQIFKITFFSISKQKALAMSLMSDLLLSFALCSHRCHGFLDCLFVTQKLHRHDRFHVLVQFVHKRNSGGQIQLHDRFVGHVIQMLDNASQRIPMGSDQDLFASLNLKRK